MQTHAEDGWRQFIHRLATLKRPEEIKDYLDLFLTYEERDNLGLRYLIVQELLKGEKTQREIAQSLGVSISKITRGSNVLKGMLPILRRILEK